MEIILSSAKELLATLVGFDTVSEKSNLPLIDFVRTYLEGFGVSCQLVPDETGTKASLFATLGEGAGGIGLSGHTDVVPVTGQRWDSDPFQLVEKGGALYGRGSADMKGYLACMLAMVPICAGRALAQPLHLIFSYDEEVGCVGVRPLIAELGERLLRPDIVVVGEPTNMGVVDAHKSIHVFSTMITGKEAHSSAPDSGVNAIGVAADYIRELNRIALDADMVGTDERFDPPRSTVHVGNIEGGIAHNIIPRNCRFMWEIRGLPNIDVDAVIDHIRAYQTNVLLPPMKAVAPEAMIETALMHNIPGFAAQTPSKAVSLALSLAGQNDVQAVSYGTEAGLFETSGIPTVICGPGSIRQAHQPNEFIDIDELAKCLKFMERLVDMAECGGGAYA